MSMCFLTTLFPASGLFWCHSISSSCILFFSFKFLVFFCNTILLSPLLMLFTCILSFLKVSPLFGFELHLMIFVTYLKYVSCLLWYFLFASHFICHLPLMSSAIASYVICHLPLMSFAICLSCHLLFASHVICYLPFMSSATCLSCHLLFASHVICY